MDYGLIILRVLYYNMYIFAIIFMISTFAYMIIKNFFAHYKRIKVILISIFIFSFAFAVFVNNYYEYYLRQQMKKNIILILKDGNYSMEIDNKQIEDKNILKKFIKLRAIVHHHSNSKECHKLKVKTKNKIINFQICLDERFNYQNWVFSDFFNKNKNFEAIGIINSRELYKKLDAFK